MEMNQYYICSSSNFTKALEWAQKQSKNGNIKLAAYVEVQSDQIMKNAQGPHQWDVPYHFARTASSVMRLGLLMATDLESCYKSNFVSVDENRGAYRTVSEPADAVAQMNNGSLLARKKTEDIRMFFSYFDTMYTYHYIMALLLGQTGQKRRSIRRQMIIVNPKHHVIWQVTSTLYIISDGEMVTKAIPFVAIWRYNPVHGDKMIVPYSPPPEYKDDDKYDDVIEGIRKTHL